MFPPHDIPRLLHPGEHVLVTLVAYDRTLRDVFKGTLTGIDAYGLLVNQEAIGQESSELVFIPWSSVRIVQKLPAQHP